MIIMSFLRQSFLFALFISIASPFSLHPLSKATQSLGKTISTRRFLSDQWEDDEELPSVTSYDDAASTLMKRKEEMDLMDQSDQGVPGVSIVYWVFRQLVAFTCFTLCPLYRSLLLEYSTTCGRNCFYSHATLPHFPINPYTFIYINTQVRIRRTRGTSRRCQGPDLDARHGDRFPRSPEGGGKAGGPTRWERWFLLCWS